MTNCTWQKTTVPPGVLVEAGHWHITHSNHIQTK